MSRLWLGVVGVALAAGLVTTTGLIVTRLDNLSAVQAYQAQMSAVQAQALLQIAAQGRSPARTEAFEKRGY